MKFELLGNVIPLKYSEKHLAHFLPTRGPLASFSSTIREERVRTNVIMNRFAHLDIWSRIIMFISPMSRTLKL